MTDGIQPAFRHQPLTRRLFAAMVGCPFFDNCNDKTRPREVATIFREEEGMDYEMFDATLFAQACLNGIEHAGSLTTNPSIATLVSVLFNQRRGPLKSTAEYGEFYDGLLTVCFRETNVETVSRIIGGVIIAEPSRAHHWLEKLEEFFGPDGKSVMRRLAGALDRPWFPYAVVLGLFQAHAWLDRHAKCPNAFSVKFPETITTMVMSCNDVVYTEDVDPLGDYGKVYGASLSRAVKAWVRDSQQNGTLSRERQVSAEELIQRVVKILDADEGVLTPFGAQVLDELNYAVWGMYSTEARARSIVLLKNFCDQ
jgi:hypothetical protein